MSDDDKPPVPAGLNERASMFWRRSVDDYELTDAELLILRELVCTLDEIDRLDEAIRIDGVMVPGSMGQTRPHPGLSQIRASRQLVARLLSQLDLPDLEGESLPSPMQARGRQAARKRWAAAPPSLRAMRGGNSGAA